MANSSSRNQSAKKSKDKYYPTMQTRPRPGLERITILDQKVLGEPYKRRKLFDDIGIRDAERMHSNTPVKSLKSCDPAQ